jgi:hypothetical protein
MYSPLLAGAQNSRSAVACDECADDFVILLLVGNDSEQSLSVGSGQFEPTAKEDLVRSRCTDREAQ